MDSLFNVGRDTIGVFLFPISLYVLFVFNQEHTAYYVVSVLVLTVSDAAAALIGKRYGSIQFEVEESTKSAEGTLAFLAITFLCVHLPLLLMTDLPKEQTVLVALILGIALTGFELISLYGTDNLVLPLGTNYILHRIFSYPYEITINTLRQLLVAIFLSFVLFGVSKRVSFTAKVTLILYLFGFMTLTGYWSYAVSFLLFVLLLAYFVATDKQEGRYGIPYFLYIAFFPVVHMFVAAEYNLDEALLPFLISLISVLVHILTARAEPSQYRLRLVASLFGFSLLLIAPALLFIKEGSILFAGAVVSLALGISWGGSLLLPFDKKSLRFGLALGFCSSGLGWCFQSVLSKGNVYTHHLLGF